MTAISSRILILTGSLSLVSSLVLAQVSAPQDVPANPQSPAVQPPQKPDETKPAQPGAATSQTEAKPAEARQAEQPRQPADATPRPRNAQPGRDQAAQPGEAAQSRNRNQASPQRQSAEAQDADRTPQVSDPQRRQTDGSQAEGRNQRTESGTADERRARARQGLGIQFDETTEGSLTVNAVDEGGIAAQAGLQARDRILSIDGQSITNSRQLQAYLRGRYDRPVPVIIDRGGQRYTIQFSPRQPEGEGAWLGVYLQDAEGDQGGARITSVYPGGPAARAGLRTGDVILQLNGQPVASTPDLIATIDGLEPSSRVEFGVWRNGRQLSLPAVLGNRENFVHYQQQYEAPDSFGVDDDDYEFTNVPPHAMQLEHDRRMAEQHQRIELELRKLQEEVRQLREALSQRR